MKTPGLGDRGDHVKCLACDIGKTYAESGEGGDAFVAGYVAGVTASIPSMAATVESFCEEHTRLANHMDGLLEKVREKIRKAKAS